MVCIEVSLDGEVFRTAGIANASIISPILSGFIAGDAAATLRLGGMCDLSEERTAHVYWASDEVDLKSGTVVTFRFVDSDHPSEAEQIVSTGYSSEYIEEQRKPAARKESFVPDSTQPPRKFPDLTFHCRVNERPAVAARFNAGEEHILCSVLWEKWRPDYFRVLVDSFGKEPKKNGKTKWIHRDLSLGDQLEIRVTA